MNRHPEFLEVLRTQGVRYTRVVGEQDNPKSPIGRGWKNIFKVESKEDAEKKMSAEGYEFEWVESPENGCKITSKVLPAVRVSKSGQNVFANQMVAVFNGWIDDHNCP